MSTDHLLVSFLSFNTRASALARRFLIFAQYCLNSSAFNVFCSNSSSFTAFLMTLASALVGGIPLSAAARRRFGTDPDSASYFGCLDFETTSDDDDDDDCGNCFSWRRYSFFA